MTVHLPRRLHAPAVDVCAHGNPVDTDCEGCYWDEHAGDTWGTDCGEEIRCQVCLALPPADFRGPCRECGAPAGHATDPDHCINLDDLPF